VPSLSDLTADRRKLFLAITGGVVGLALLTAVLVSVTGGDSDDDTPAAPSGPIELTAPATQEVFTLAGDPGTLRPEDLDAAMATVETYLNAAALEAPLVDPESTSTTSPEGAVGRGDARAQFTDAAAGRFATDDALALSDAHLAPAKSASPQTASVDAVTGLVGDDGAGQLVVLTISVTTRVDLDGDITITRTGDLVLEPVDGAWRISGYQLRVERSRDGETTTSEAAFGE